MTGPSLRLHKTPSVRHHSYTWSCTGVLVWRYIPERTVSLLLIMWYNRYTFFEYRCITHVRVRSGSREIDKYRYRYEVPEKTLEQTKTWHLQAMERECPPPKRGANNMPPMCSVRGQHGILEQTTGQPENHTPHPSAALLHRAIGMRPWKISFTPPGTRRLILRMTAR